MLTGRFVYLPTFHLLSIFHTDLYWKKCLWIFRSLFVTAQQISPPWHITSVYYLQCLLVTHRFLFYLLFPNLSVVVQWISFLYIRRFMFPFQGGTTEQIRFSTCPFLTALFHAFFLGGVFFWYLIKNPERTFKNLFAWAQNSKPEWFGE